MSTYFHDASLDVDTVVHQRDCIAGMGELVAAGSIDVVVTSPPYNLGIRYTTYDDTLPRGEYLDWIEEWGEALCRVLSDNGSLFLNIGGKPSDPWGPFEVLQRLRRRFVLQNTFHWIKSIAIDADAVGSGSGITDDTAIGHYKPINSKRYVNDCHEYIFHLTKQGDVELDRLAIGVAYQDKSNIHRWATAGGGRRCRGNTWFVPYQTIRSRDRDRPHPATFPIRIPTMCIRVHGAQRVRQVMDPFLGLGHTALACKALRIPFVGFEIDRDYFAQACQLIRDFDPACPPTAAREEDPGQLSLFPPPASPPGV